MYFLAVERRSAIRFVRRLRVLFSNSRGKAAEGLTVNLSSTGMLVDTKHRWPAGHRLRVELCEGGESVVLEGVVVRVVAGQGGDPYCVAVRFLRAPELLSGLLPGLDWNPIAQPGLRPRPAAAPPNGVSANGARRSAESPTSSRPAPGHFVPKTYKVSVGEKRALRKLYDGELRYGGLFVSSSDRPCLDTLVFVDLTMAWLRTHPLRLTGRVVQTVDGAHGGFAIELDSSKSVLASVERMLGLG